MVIHKKGLNQHNSIVLLQSLRFTKPSNPNNRAGYKVSSLFFKTNKSYIW